MTASDRRRDEATGFVEPHDVDENPPTYGEVHRTARAVCSAIAPDGGLTDLQRLIMESAVEAMTGFRLDVGSFAPATPVDLAVALARRNRVFRTRIVQMMVLGEMVLTPLPPQVCERVGRKACSPSPGTTPTAIWAWR